MTESVERFSSRVENYAKYRPGYPAEIIDLLKAECHLMPESIVADIGSGTGKLSELFLQNGNTVLGVEPNAAMRISAEVALKNYPKFKSVDGTAESANIPSASVDFVTAGQAFHWFDPRKAKAEYHRILKPNGWAVLIWNERLLDTTAFLRDYEQLLLRYGTDYLVVRHEKAVSGISQFFPGNPCLRAFANIQEFDFAGLKGRVLSSSYTPEPNHPNYNPMLNDLRELFKQYETDGKIRIDYETKVYYGRLGG